MPDALPAPAADPRAPAANRLITAANALVPLLASGQTIDTATLRDAMTGAFGDTDAAGAWIWKDAYEAVEAAVVIFLQLYGPSIRRLAGRGADSPFRLQDMLTKLARLEPSQTMRSEEQLRLQQFSTPLPLAHTLVHAAAIRPGDTVLEPSAGTGMLAVMAQLFLGARAQEALRLNELSSDRHDLLTVLFPNASITSHDAETIADRAAGLRPTVVVMNPPFSASLGNDLNRQGADLRHVRSAFSMLPPGGRLAAITSSNCIPGDAAWQDAFQHLDPPARTVFTMAIDGRNYARRGTSFQTRLTVLDRDSRPAPDIDTQSVATDAPALLEALADKLPPRPPVRLSSSPASSIHIGRDLFGEPLRPGNTSSLTPIEQDWGPVSELDVHTSAAKPSEHTPSESDNGASYHPWMPTTIIVPGAAPHPDPLVQSTAMAAVPHPTPTYRPLLPESLVTEGLLSDAQLETVVLAGQAHSRLLPASYRIGSGWETVRRCQAHHDNDNEPDTVDGELLSEPVQFRQGYFLGDGTGCGKGRQVAGIILDNWLRGRKRALWISLSDLLIEDARRDWTDLGGHPDQVVPIGRFPLGSTIPIAEGILFTTFATLRSPARQGRPSRLEQIVSWLAGTLDEDDRRAYDGVIVTDESHALANAAGSGDGPFQRRPSEQGRVGLRLQNALPNTRVVYSSATGADTVQALAYAPRLGLWGTGDTTFETRLDFVAAMETGGVAAMEVVARDLKALGLYQARALSFAGVEVDILEHQLTPEQRRIYDAYAGAFKLIHTNIQRVLEATAVTHRNATLNRRAKAAALSAFESTKQRFFGHLLTSMACPSVFRAIEADLDAGHSAVIQLISTGQSLLERRIADIPTSEWDDIRTDLTPREYVIDYLMHSFPTRLHETFTQDGHRMSRPAFDQDGKPVFSQEAIEQRDRMIEELALLPPVPCALDRIVHHFGHEAVAEITGRSRRIVRINDSRGERLALRTRPSSSNLSEATAFMDGKKRILVFSQAGGTGRGYHSDKRFANTQRRIHYLLEPGWRANMAIQGLGRTNRTYQAWKPVFRPVTTDVKGQRRFISTIARRLDTLGAITRGQRNSQTSMGHGNKSLFRESDNLESPYARAALRSLYNAIARGRIDNWSVSDFEAATGLKIQHNDQLKEDLPPMPRFLNRLLALPIDQQNELFTALEQRIATNIELAIEAGTYELGVETLRAHSFAIAGSEILYEHPATDAATELVEIRRRDPVEHLSADAAVEIATRHCEPGRRPQLVLNTRSQRAAIVTPANVRILDDGNVQNRVRLIRPAASETVSEAELASSNWQTAPESTWKPVWEHEIAGLPDYAESRFWLATGLLLPVWDRISSQHMKVRRLITDDGRPLLGRVITVDEVQRVRTAFGLAGTLALTGKEAFDAIFLHGKPLSLSNGWRITRRRVMGIDRAEIEGPSSSDAPLLKRLGCSVEIVSYSARFFAPQADVLDRIVQRWPLVA